MFRTLLASLLVLAALHSAPAFANETIHVGEGPFISGGPYFIARDKGYFAKLGLDVNEASGITYGVSGYWQQSSEFQVFGGRAYVIFPISHWLGAGPVMAWN